MLRYAIAVLITVFGVTSESSAATLDAREVDKFVDHMVITHGYDGASLRDLFSQAKRADAILAAISKPAETKPWHEYRPIFLTSRRIDAGLTFWKSNQALLKKASAVYGVPPELIVAIIGVETFYGRYTGGYRVVDALGTLAFHYPKRAEFFRSELIEYLLLTREEKLEPLSLNGSYAGAMGLPQFISSSFRRYAVDFDEDGRRDIWNDPADAIGSVANYVKAHGWRQGRPVVAEVASITPDASGLVSKDLMPRRALQDFIQLGLTPKEPVAADEPAVLLELEGERENEYWFGFKNFYVITRYNHSAKYAMAVTQLAQTIREARIGRTGAD